MSDRESSAQPQIGSISSSKNEGIFHDFIVSWFVKSGSFSRIMDQPTIHIDAHSCVSYDPLKNVVYISQHSHSPINCELSFVVYAYKCVQNDNDSGYSLQLQFSLRIALRWHLQMMDPLSLLVTTKRWHCGVLLNCSRKKKPYVIIMYYSWLATV